METVLNLENSIGERFLASQRELARLVDEGHVTNQSRIEKMLAEAVTDDLYLRYFFERCAIDVNHRKLCSSQSFPVFVSDTHSIRVNLWFPTGNFSSSVNKMVEDYFSIDVCHNHSFDFFTVGAFGPGYQTRFFSTECDLSSVLIGDSIDFNKEWSFQLNKGRSVFVPAGGHFHVQYVPPAFSMSINLIPMKQNTGRVPQILLKQDCSTVEKVIVRDM